MSDIVKPGALSKEEYKVEIVVDEADNPRLKLDIPANKMFIEITNTDPPYIVTVSRADQEIQSLGLLEKAKYAVEVFQVKINKKLSLTKGVAQGLSLIKGGSA
jgi:hypothetical protein